MIIVSHFVLYRLHGATVSGKHAGVRNHPQEIIGMLTEAGQSFYRNS